jgi:enoyl-CoA hydratase
VTSPPVLEERRGASVLLTFNRPDKLNALSMPLLQELERRLDAAEAQRDVRVVILTGAGEKAFVAGADIAEYAELDEVAFDEYQRLSRRVFSRIDGFGKPVIGAINGYALGGGFEIALCCDVLIASHNARFGLPEGLIGLSPGGGGTQRLTRAVGPFVAADVLLSTRRLSADEAVRVGLVSEVVKVEDLLPRAVEKADAMTKVAPLATAELLRLVDVAGDAPLEEGLTLEQEALARLRRTADATEGITAFVEKREPRFQGG